MDKKKINKLSRFLSFIKKLKFKTKREKELEQQVVGLKTELCKKQTQINRTNAYWKKKYYAVTGKSH